MLCGLLKPTSGPRDGGRVRCGPRARSGAPAHRLHVAEIFALQRSQGDREPAPLRRPLQRARQRTPATGSSGRSRWPTSKGRKISSPARCPADGNSGWHWAARCLHRPPIIFLDEPTSGVDPISRRQFWDLIHQMAQEGVTVFVTTHYMEEAEYCNRLALIFRGKMVALGTPAELKRDSHEGRVAACRMRSARPSGRGAAICS